MRQFEAERLKYPLSKYIESIKYTQRIRLMNVFGKISNKIWVFDRPVTDH